MDFQQQSQMQQPQMLPAPKKNVWLWVGLGVVAVAALAAAFYYYYASYAPMDYGPIGGTASEDTALAAIEKDLQAVPLDDLTSELNDIDKELAP